MLFLFRGIDLIGVWTGGSELIGAQHEWWIRNDKDWEVRAVERAHSNIHNSYCKTEQRTQLSTVLYVLWDVQGRMGIFWSPKKGQGTRILYEYWERSRFRRLTLSQKSILRINQNNIVTSLPSLFHWRLSDPSLYLLIVCLTYSIYDPFSPRQKLLPKGKKIWKKGRVCKKIKHSFKISLLDNLYTATAGWLAHCHTRTRTRTRR